MKSIRVVIIKDLFSLEDYFILLKRYLILVKIFRGNFVFNYVIVNLKYMKSKLRIRKLCGKDVFKIFIYNFKNSV